MIKTDNTLVVAMLEGKVYELEQWKKNACERMEGLSTSVDGYVKRIAELEKQLIDIYMDEIGLSYEDAVEQLKEQDDD